MIQSADVTITLSSNRFSIRLRGPTSATGVSIAPAGLFGMDHLSLGLGIQELRPARGDVPRPPDRTGLHPLDVALTPDVGQSHQQDGHEDHHFDEGHQAEVAEYRRPGKEKGGFDVEDDESKGDHVETDVELDPGRANRVFATLVVGELFGRGMDRLDQPRDGQAQADEQAADDQEHQHVGEVEQHQPSCPRTSQRPKPNRSAAPASTASSYRPEPLFTPISRAMGASTTPIASSIRPIVAMILPLAAHVARRRAEPGSLACGPAPQQAAPRHCPHYHRAMQASTRTPGRIIDLSHTIHSGMVTYPGLPGPEISDFLSRAASAANYAEGATFQIGQITM